MFFSERGKFRHRERKTWGRWCEKTLEESALCRPGEGGLTDLPLTAQSGAKPAGYLDLEFSLQNRGKIKFCCLSPQFGSLLQQLIASICTCFLGVSSYQPPDLSKLRNPYQLLQLNGQNWPLNWPGETLDVFLVAPSGIVLSQGLCWDSGSWFKPQSSSFSFLLLPFSLFSKATFKM